MPSKNTPDSEPSERELQRASLPPKRSATLYLVLIGLALAAMGSIFTYLLARSYLDARQTRSWPETQALIILSDIEERQIGPAVPTDYRHRLLYGYQWQGEKYTGTHEKPRENPWSKKRAEVEDQVAQYAPGSTHPCYVNPADPSQAILAHDTQAAGYSIWFPALFIVGGLGITIAALGKSRKN
ncbi:MAG: DUF3592 domain-containing protein [Verrucomicrobiales bacterium]